MNKLIIFTAALLGMVSSSAPAFSQNRPLRQLDSLPSDSIYRIDVLPIVHNNLYYQTSVGALDSANAAAGSNFYWKTTGNSNLNDLVNWLGNSNGGLVNISSGKPIIAGLVDTLGKDSFFLINLFSPYIQLDSQLHSIWIGGFDTLHLANNLALNASGFLKFKSSASIYDQWIDTVHYQVINDSVHLPYTFLSQFICYYDTAAIICTDNSAPLFDAFNPATDIKIKVDPNDVFFQPRQTIQFLTKGIKRMWMDSAGSLLYFYPKTYSNPDSSGVVFVLGNLRPYGSFDSSFALVAANAGQVLSGRNLLISSGDSVEMEAANGLYLSTGATISLQAQQYYLFDAYNGSPSGNSGNMNDIWLENGALFDSNTITTDTPNFGQIHFAGGNSCFCNNIMDSAISTSFAVPAIGMIYGTDQDSVCWDTLTGLLINWYDTYMHEGCSMNHNYWGGNNTDIGDIFQFIQDNISYNRTRGEAGLVPGKFGDVFQLGFDQVDSNTVDTGGTITGLLQMNSRFNNNRFKYHIGQDNWMLNSTVENATGSLYGNLFFNVSVDFTGDTNSYEKILWMGPGSSIALATSSPPQQPLDVNGNALLHDSTFLNHVQISDGTEGAGKVLTSDANGNATWQTNIAATNFPKVIYSYADTGVTGGFQQHSIGTGGYPDETFRLSVYVLVRSGTSSGMTGYLSYRADDDSVIDYNPNPVNTGTAITGPGLYYFTDITFRNSYAGAISWGVNGSSVGTLKYDMYTSLEDMGY